MYLCVSGSKKRLSVIHKVCTQTEVNGRGGSKPKGVTLPAIEVVNGAQLVHSAGLVRSSNTLILRCAECHVRILTPDQ